MELIKMTHSSCLMPMEKLWSPIQAIKDYPNHGSQDSIIEESAGPNTRHIKSLIGWEQLQMMKQMIEFWVPDGWLVVADRPCSDLTEFISHFPWNAFLRNKLVWILKQNLNFSWIAIQCRSMVTEMPGSRECLDKVIVIRFIYLYLRIS